MRFLPPRWQKPIFAKPVFTGYYRGKNHQRQKPVNPEMMSP
jgi:hypothetical protein